MGKLSFSFVLAAVLLFQWAPVHGQNSPSAPAQQAAHPVQLDSKTAQTLLLHKEEPACRKDHDGTRITGTVVVAVTIDRNGNVSRTRTVSGPKLLQPLALAALRKYQYKPYLLNETPVAFETVVSVRMDCFFYTGQA